MYKSTVQAALKQLGYDLKQSEMKVGVKKESNYDLITLNGELLCSSSDYAQMVTWIQAAIKEDPKKYDLDPRVLESEVNEGMISPKMANGFKIGDKIKTQKGTYTITGFGSRTGATRDFEAENEKGEQFNLRVSLRGATGIQVAAGKSLNFPEQEEMLESHVNEGDMTKDYDGFIVQDRGVNKNYKFRYIKGTNNKKVEDEAIAKLVKKTGAGRHEFWVNGFVRKGEWDKSDAEVLESANEAKDLSYWKDYAEGHHQSPKWYSDEVKSASEITKLVDKVIKFEQSEAEIPFEIDAKDEKALVKLATDYFNQFKTINGNVISAMIFQEAY